MTNPPTATHGVAISTSILVSQAMIRVNDIICGNGKKYRHTQGNEMYHMLVGTFVDEYARQTSRNGKTMITKAIVEAIRMAKPPGRFLKKEKDGCFFYEIGDRKAWVKTGQLLRDKVLEKKRKEVNKKPPLNRTFDAISSKSGTPPPATISTTSTSTTRQEYVSFMTSFPPVPAPMFLPVAFNECHYDRSCSAVNTRLNHL